MEHLDFATCRALQEILGETESYRVMASTWPQLVWRNGKHAKTITVHRTNLWGLWVATLAPRVPWVPCPSPLKALEMLAKERGYQSVLYIKKDKTIGECFITVGRLLQANTPEALVSAILNDIQERTLEREIALVDSDDDEIVRTVV